MRNSSDPTTKKKRGESLGIDFWRLSKDYQVSKEPAALKPFNPNIDSTISSFSFGTTFRTFSWEGFSLKNTFSWSR